MKQYWLVKSEPDTYSWDDLVKEEVGTWDGVRNYAARNNLKEMKLGDWVLFYHSVSEKAVVGIAEVVEEFFQDPTSDDERWVSVKLAPVRKLNLPVSLKQIKDDKRLENMPLIKLSRLSVSSLKSDEFETILELSETQV